MPIMCLIVLVVRPRGLERFTEEFFAHAEVMLDDSISNCRANRLKSYIIQGADHIFYWLQQLTTQVLEWASSGYWFTYIDCVAGLRANMKNAKMLQVPSSASLGKGLYPARIEDVESRSEGMYKVSSNKASHSLICSR